VGWWDVWIFITRKERVSAIRISLPCRSNRIFLGMCRLKGVGWHNSLISKRAPLSITYVTNRGVLHLRNRGI
jgi:hypothetical protein